MREKMKQKKRWLGIGAAAFFCMSFPAAALADSPVIGVGETAQKESGGTGAMIETGRGPGETGNGAELTGSEEYSASAGMADPGRTDAAIRQTVYEDTTADPNRFVLPENAGMLVVVEGTGGSNCKVFAYEKTDDGWVRSVTTAGYLGRNGMSNNRREGDKTTPIGLFQMNTPFGQKDRLEGFPENYIKVNTNHVWSQLQNRLVEDPSMAGERVGTSGYSEYYDYAIDAGYNKNAVSKKGSALFLHCFGHGRTETSGCVSIPEDQMIAIMRLYGTWGDGACYIAQAPAGTFELVYDSYGVNNGLSPDGDFTS